MTSRDVPRITVTHRDIDEAEARRKGESASGILPRALLPAGAAVFSVGFAAWAMTRVAFLFRGVSLGGIDAVLGEVERLAIGAIAAGMVSLAIAVTTLVALSRGRLHRSIPLLTLALGSVVGASGAVLVGGLYWFGTLAYSFRHTSMPPRIVATESPADAVINATVVLFAPGVGGDVLSSAVGTGTIVGRRANEVVVLTCSHVAMPYESPAAWRDPSRSSALWLSFADGRQVEGRVSWVSPPPLDFALVGAVLDNAPPPVSVARDSGGLAVGEEVLFVPNPFRGGWLVHHGRLLGRREHNTPAGPVSLLVTDLAVQPGDSGSGLFNQQGELVGVNTWRMSGPSGDGALSLPSEVLTDLLSELPKSPLGEQP